jgi:hypothetical protein
MGEREKKGITILDENINVIILLRRLKVFPEENFNNSQNILPYCYR